MRSQPTSTPASIPAQHAAPVEPERLEDIFNTYHATIRDMPTSGTGRDETSSEPSAVPAFTSSV